MPHLGALLPSTAKLPDGVALVIGASPWSYVAPSNGTLVVTGGTITQMTYTRNGTNTNFGSNTRLCSMRRGDTITTTYSVVPTGSSFISDGT